MKIIDCDGVYEPGNMNQLDTVSSRRYNSDANSFWIAEDVDAYPKLSLLVNGDLATFHFFPQEYDAGLSVVGRMKTLDLAQSTRFMNSRDPADDVSVVNTAVIATSTALQAAKEFFHSRKLPQSVEWMQL